MPRLLPLFDREPRPDAINNAEMAQFHLWLAQAQRDHGNLGIRDLAKMETVAGALARRAKMMFNPFTGEIRPYHEIWSCYDHGNPLHRYSKERR